MDQLSWIHIDEEIKHIFQQYYRLHGVRLSIFTTRGERLYPDIDQKDCTYCQRVREDLGFESRCVALDRSMISRSIRKNCMIRYRCHGGMEEAALPLQVDGKTIGCIMLGQFRRKGADTSPYEPDGVTLYGDNRLNESFRASPAFTEDTISLLMDTYRFLLGLIARERMIRNRDYNPFMPLLEKLERDTQWNPSIEEAATISGQSPSSLNRLIRKATGKSFKAFLIETKLVRAEELFTRFPGKTIAEIASELGYADPLYFSRIYKRYRGVSPKQMRERSSKDLSPPSASHDSRQLDPAAAAMFSERGKS